jgi:hypothetical protein
MVETRCFYKCQLVYCFEVLVISLINECFQVFKRFVEDVVNVKSIIDSSIDFTRIVDNRSDNKDDIIRVLSFVV